MTLWFCIGTAAELIKLAPVIWEAQARGIPWRALSTGQSPQSLLAQWEDFGWKSSQLCPLLPSTQDLARSSDALRWFARLCTLRTSRVHEMLREYFGDSPVSHSPRAGDAWIVHGDTLSTLGGAWLGRRLGLRVAHVEAGLRSPKLWEPFPEELSRRLVSRLAHIHFCQDEVAVHNLRRSRVRGEVVATGANTLLDTLHHVLGVESPERAEPFVLANLHRFENLNSQERWSHLLRVLGQATRSGSQPVLSVMHATSRAKLESEPEVMKKLENQGVKLLPRLKFTEFIRLLARARYIISDGGSNQEECAYLGQPCLIMRDATERREGLAGGSCVLSQFDQEKIDAFLNNPEAHRRPALNLSVRPSETIVETLCPRA